MPFLKCYKDRCLTGETVSVKCLNIMRSRERFLEDYLTFFLFSEYKALSGEYLKLSVIALSLCQIFKRTPALA